jgi:vacuolar-type H+-ATPase subunit E/Vma4
MTEDPLRPVRAALLGRAQEQADGRHRAAEATAATAVAAARRQADAIVAEARSAGRAEGETAAQAARARARREARAIVLAAHRSAFEDLRRQVYEAIAGLRDDPGYPRLVERLTELAKAAAGPGAAVVEHPDGGVEAWAAGVRVDLTTGALADRAVAGLAGKAARLWEA